MQAVLFSAEVPRVATKNSQHDAACKASTLEMLDQDYNTSVWTHVCTDGPSDASFRNGGSGIHICIGIGKSLLKSLVAGALLSNNRAKLTALHEAARLLNAEMPPLSHIIFLTDSKSAVQRLQSHKQELERDTHHLLCDLSQHSKVAVQWFSAHCGLTGNFFFSFIRWKLQSPQ